MLRLLVTFELLYENEQSNLQLKMRGVFNFLEKQASLFCKQQAWMDRSGNWLLESSPVPCLRMKGSLITTIADVSSGSCSSHLHSHRVFGLFLIFTLQLGSLKKGRLWAFVLSVQWPLVLLQVRTAGQLNHSQQRVLSLVEMCLGGEGKTYSCLQSAFDS